jgi:hypothetical protein
MSHRRNGDDGREGPEERGHPEEGFLSYVVVRHAPDSGFADSTSERSHYTSFAHQ